MKDKIQVWYKGKLTTKYLLLEYIFDLEDMNYRTINELISFHTENRLVNNVFGSQVLRTFLEKKMVFRKSIINPKTKRKVFVYRITRKGKKIYEIAHKECLRTVKATFIN